MTNEPKNIHAVELGRKGGKVGGKSTSTRKKEASRRNGHKGGRPKKTAKLEQHWNGKFTDNQILKMVELRKRGTPLQGDNG